MTTQKFTREDLIRWATPVASFLHEVSVAADQLRDVVDSVIDQAAKDLQDASDREAGFPPASEMADKPDQWREFEDGIWDEAGVWRPATQPDEKATESAQPGQSLHIKGTSGAGVRIQVNKP